MELQSDEWVSPPAETSQEQSELEQAVAGDQPLSVEADAVGSVPEGQPDWEPLAVRVEGGLAELRELFATRLAYDQFKEQQIDRLHSELQIYKEGFLRRVLQPLVMGLIRLHDDLSRHAEAVAARGPEELSRERVLSDLDGFREDVEILLEQHGVTRYQVGTEAFDSRRQIAARTRPTSDAAQVGCVAERLRPGFELAEFQLQKERVVVFVAQPTQNETVEKETP
ncbi:MAG: nucleotide exchange factor GrpE [Thermoanaerobaculia bacterium]